MAAFANIGFSDSRSQHSRYGLVASAPATRPVFGTSRAHQMLEKGTKEHQGKVGSQLAAQALFQGTDMLLGGG